MPGKHNNGRGMNRRDHVVRSKVRVKIGLDWHWSFFRPTSLTGCTCVCRFMCVQVLVGVWRSAISAGAVDFISLRLGHRVC